MLPVLLWSCPFGMHPCFPGVFGSSRVQYVADHTLRIVFLSTEPSIVMTYDTVQSLHTVWALRRVKPEVHVPWGAEIPWENSCVHFHALTCARIWDLFHL